MEIKILWGEQIVARQISEVGFFLKGHHSDGKNNLIKFLEDHTKIYKTFGADIDACGMYVFTLILKFESGELSFSKQ